jgi:hypothetical protein
MAAALAGAGVDPIVKLSAVMVRSGGRLNVGAIPSPLLIQTRDDLVGDVYNDVFNFRGRPIASARVRMSLAI